MSDEDLYDEFGNYIGPDLDSESSDSGDDAPSDGARSDLDSDDEMRSRSDSLMDTDAASGGGGGALPSSSAIGPSSTAVVLHEDKEHYPSAADVYGAGVRVATIDEDSQAIEEPIVAPDKVKNFTVMTGGDGSDEPLAFKIDPQYSLALMETAVSLNRVVAVVGSLHSGKTSLLDVLLQQATRDNGKYFPATSQLPGPRFTDTLLLEQQRGLSTKSCPLSLALPTTAGKTYNVTFLDCPGHVDFHDETTASYRCADGCVLVVDAAVGLTMHDEMCLSEALTEGLSIVLVLNKLDRLILELKLPPADAYFKLQHSIDSANVFIKSRNPSARLLSPDRGNVAFASSMHGYSFTVQSFAAKYFASSKDAAKVFGPRASALSPNDFAKRLWGDCYLDVETGQFVRSPAQCSKALGPVSRTFVSFVLEPIYKLYGACLGEDETEAARILLAAGVSLPKSHMKMSACPLLRSALSTFFGGQSTAVVDMLEAFVPSPMDNATNKVRKHYTGSQDGALAKAMAACDPSGPLMIAVSKLYPSSDGSSFSALGRIYSGTVKPGDRVRVLGENYSLNDTEDCAFATVKVVSVPHARFETRLSRGVAGNVVLLAGVDASVAKTCTITDDSRGGAADDDGEGDKQIFRPLSFHVAGGEAAVRVAVEPLNPAELPKMVEGLRRVGKSYPMSRTKVEESGEHVIFGTGELYLDCVLHDLRNVYSGIEVKVADPVVSFCETVVDMSNVKCFAETPNKKNKLTFISEPLDDGLAMDIEKGVIDLSLDKRVVGEFFQSKYKWDLLSARSVWAFGPTSLGPNILMDDTLPSEVDKNLLLGCKQSLVQGFQWAMREGPLCEEPVRNVKTKIIDATIASTPILRGGGQIIPTARRAIYSSILTASPRLMEPVYSMQIQCPGDIVGAIAPLLAKRRGHIVQDLPRAGAPFNVVRAYMPVIDSFGFETDLRSFTSGQAMIQSVLSHYAVVPGNPLDKSIILHPLEPSPVPHLAREFMVKSRRRKGLSDDVSVLKYFDVDMINEISADNN